MIGVKAKKEIENELDELVEKSQNLIDETRVSDSRLEKTQFRNLLDLASSSDSFKVIENFILYQMGRDTKRENWSKSSDGKAFGDLIIDNLKSLEEKAKEIANKTKEDTKAIHLELIRLYLGFANRYFTYKKKAEGGGK
jgi:hypothetical protein